MYVNIIRKIICIQIRKQIIFDHNNSFQPHVLKTLKYINQYIDEHPLCCCVDEIANVKKLMDSDKTSETSTNSKELESKDKIKLSQKTSTISLHVYKDEYFIKTKIKIPDDYPENQIR